MLTLRVNEYELLRIERAWMNTGFSTPAKVAQCLTHIGLHELNDNASFLGLIRNCQNYWGSSKRLAIAWACEG